MRWVQNLLVVALLFLNSTVGFGQNQVALGKLKSAALTEVSGIIPYTYAKGYFWVHNDSGNKNAIYLIDSLANLKTTVILEGIKAIDWEDIARYSHNGENYLLIGDTGNNLRSRDILSFYSIKEPQIDLSIPRLQIPNSDITEVKVKYADKKRDVEAFFVDPVDKKVYLISKRDFRSTVFSFSIDKTNEVHVLKPEMTLPFNFVTAADISSDGSAILIKNLTNIYFWERKATESILQTLSKPYRKLNYSVEPQGEAICFDLNSTNFYTISERPFGLDAYLYRYDY